MKALITGGGGFCGRHLIQRLETAGVEAHSVGIRILDRPRHHVIGDVTDFDALSGILRTVRPNFVFHLAGTAAPSAPFVFYRVNSEYAATLLAAIAESRNRECPVLLAGSSAEYGLVSENDVPIAEDRCPQPVSHYGISKLAQTHIGLAASQLGCPVVVVRSFNVVGPGMPSHLSLQDFATQISRIAAGLAPPTISVGNLNVSRDFVDVRDAVDVYWDVIRSEACRGQVVNVCSGRATLLSDALSTLLELAGVTAEIRHDTKRARALEATVHFGSTRKLETMIGARRYRPLVTTLKDILLKASPGS